MRRSRFLGLFLLAALLPAQAPKPAQAPAPADRLQQLLQELRQLDAKAWSERLAALEAEARAHEQQAAARREQARKLEQEAAADDRDAKAVRAEMEQLRSLQKIVLELHGTPAAGPAAAGKAEAKSDAPSKAEAKDAPAKPAMAGAKTDAKTEAKTDAPAKAEKAGAPPKKDETGARTAPAKAPGPPPGAAAARASPSVTWAEVEGIFSDHCAGCHDPDTRKGGLDLTSFAAALQGGGSGRSIVPGEPDQSRLYRLISLQERPFMPRDADPLGADLQARIRQWIEQGAAEDQDGARAFLAAKANAAKAAAAAAEAAVAGPPPLPANLPAAELRVPARPVPVQALQRSPRAGLLALPGCGQVLLRDAEFEPLGILPCELAKVATVAFSADGALVAAAGGEAGRSGCAIVYDVRTGRVLGKAGKERDVPLALAVHHAQDGSCRVALGGSGKRARVYALADGSELLAGKHDDFVLGLAFSPDGSLLAAGDRAGNLVLWELDGGHGSQALAGHKGAVQAVAFHPSGKWLLSTGDDGTLRLWDVAEAKERWRQSAHRGAGLAVAFGPGDAVASAGSDGRIAVYTSAGRSIATSAAAGDWLYGLAFGADDGTVFAGDAQGRVHRFAVKSRKLSAMVPLQPAQ